MTADTGDVLLEIEGLTARGEGGAVLVDDVSLRIPRGAFVAVVGPTGAGKTKFLEAMIGLVDDVDGRVVLDGRDVTADAAAIRRSAGYVPQDDVLHPDLPLRRSLLYAAALRLPDAGTAERAALVDGVLDELGLGSRADQRVRTLSGGQRKRASVAAELLAAPSLLLLDEPTSGLDPAYERSLLRSLRRLSDDGRTVVAVTHSLQALDECDLVLFLAPGGRVAFFGPPAAAIAHFGEDDVVDVFAALERRPHEAGRAAARRRRVRRRNAPEGAALPTTAGPARRQLATLVRRYVDGIRADRRNVALLALQAPVLGALLWAVLAPDGLRPGPLQPAPGAASALFLVVTATWLGATNAVREIVKERRIVEHERASGVGPLAYVASKVVVLGAVTAAQCSVLAIVATARQGVPADGALLPSGLLELVVTVTLVGLAATALGLLVSAIVATPDKALTVLPVALVAEFVLAGAWASTLSVPGIPALRAVTATRWGAEAVQATVAADPSTWLRANAVLAAIALVGWTGAVVVLARRELRAARLGTFIPRPTVLAPALGVLLVTGVAAASTLGRTLPPPAITAAPGPATSAAAAPPAPSPAGAPAPDATPSDEALPPQAPASVDLPVDVVPARRSPSVAIAPVADVVAPVAGAVDDVVDGSLGTIGGVVDALDPATPPAPPTSTPPVAAPAPAVTVPVSSAPLDPFAFWTDWVGAWMGAFRMFAPDGR